MSQNKPTIVCLCGSTKFKEAFEKANYEETMKGKIVLSIGCYAHFDKITLTEEDREMLDDLHKRKIDFADEVLFLNVDGYMGKSTKGELAYALEHKKIVRFLHPELTIG